MMSLMISPCVAARVVGGELRIPLPSNVGRQIEVFLQEPLPGLGDRHRRIAHTRLLLARARPAETGKFASVGKALDVAHESFNARRDHVSYTPDLLKSLIWIQALVDFSNTWLQPFGFQLGMFHPIQFGNQLLLDLGIVKGELPGPAQVGVQLGSSTKSFEDPNKKVIIQRPFSVMMKEKTQFC